MKTTEKTQLLAGLLKTYCGKTDNRLPFPDEIETANRDWAATHFFFSLLQFAKRPPRPTAEAFATCRAGFLAETGQEIDTNLLISKHWVRRYGGEIRISQQIQNLFSHFRDYGKGQPKPDFWEKHQVEIHFLFCFNEKYPDEDKPSTIPKDKFFELAEKHRSLFPKMPDWENLDGENQWFLEATDAEIAMKFPHNQLNPDFPNEVSTLVWKDLLEKNEGRDLAELLFEWENRTLKSQIWPNGFLQKLPPNAREKFLEAIFQRIENEEDLMRPEQEIIKGKLDHYLFDGGNFNPDTLPNFPLQGDSLFEKFREAEYWQGVFDVFYHQPARSGLRFFLREIFALEKALSFQVWETNALKNAEKLLKLCHERPALLYMFCKLVAEDFPEILPVFFRSPETISLGCLLVRDLTIRPEILPEQHNERELPEEETRSRIFQIAFETALTRSSAQSNANYSGKIAYEALLPLAEKVFEQQGLKKRAFSVANELRQRYQNAWNLLLASRSNADSTFLQTPHELADFAQGFLDCLKNQSNLPAWSELKRLDLPTLLMFASLFHVLRSMRKPFADNADLEKLESKIVEEFVAFYQGEFSRQEIEVLNLSENALEVREIQWFQELAFLDFFDFEPILDIDANLLEKLLDAVRPENFEKCPPPETWPPHERHTWRPMFEQKFRSEIVKFRAHFRFVLRLYRTLFSKNAGAKRTENWENAEAEIRKRLHAWAKFNRNDEVKGLFDAFDPMLENFSPLPTLVQDVAQTVNLFPEEKHRKLFVERLTEGVARLDFLLKIHNQIEGNSCRQHIMKLIPRLDVQVFIEDQHSWDTIETALVEATNAEPFVEIAERLLAFVREKGTWRGTFLGHELPRFVLEIQLVLAFRKGDRSLADLAVQQYKAEKSKKYDPEIEQRRRFFEALFLMQEKKFGEAAKILEQLARLDGSIEIHYRKLLNAMSWALNENDDLQSNPRILSAWQDWENYESGNTKQADFEKYREGIVFCRMAWLTARDANEEFDFYKSQLSRSTLLEMDVLRLVLKNYSRRRGMDLAAGELLSEARQSATSDSKKLDELNSLQKWFDPAAHRNAIRKFFKDLSVLPLEELVQTIPKLERRHQNVHGFLLSEFLHIAEEMMRKITAVVKIKKENPYNDLFTVLLRARLSYLGFEVSDQAREGKSPTKIDAGELDMTVRFGSKEIAVYEAFIFRDEKRTTEHLRKVFDYDPTGNLFFTIVIFNGKDEDFDKEFEEYMKIVEAKNTFPSGHEPQNGFEKVEGFSDLRNIFLGKTTHGSDETVVTMFHLFLNLSY